MKELDLKLTLGMAERRLTESPPDEESWRGGQRFKSRPDPKSPSHGVWLFLVLQSATIPVEHSSDVKQRPKKICFYLHWQGLRPCWPFRQKRQISALSPTRIDNYPKQFFLLEIIGLFGTRFSTLLWYVSALLSQTRNCTGLTLWSWAGFIGH